MNQSYLKSLRSLAVAAMIGSGCGLVNAQAVIFPQQAQPGVASVSSEGSSWTLSNDLLSATFSEKDGLLLFDGCEALGLKPGTELFIIELADGTRVPASLMTHGEVTTTPLAAEPDSPNGAKRFPGQAVTATFTYGDLSIQWQATLRDGSHYLRTELALTAAKDVEMRAVVPMNYNVAEGEPTPVSVGNTRGAIIASSKIFAGVESPMGINSIGATTGAGDEIGRETQSEGFSISAWTPETFCWTPGRDVPSQVIELGFNDSEVVGAFGQVNFESAGTHTITFAYTSGTHRLNIVGIDITDLDGAPVASDYHVGFTGGQASNNSYTLNVPEAGTYVLRYFVEIKTETITASGKITIAGGNVTLNSGNDPAAVVIPEDGADRYWTIHNYRSERYVVERDNKLTSDATIESAEARWHFLKRADDTWDIVNSATGNYVCGAAYNTTLTTSATAPEKGWVIKPSNDPSLMIITNGEHQFNTTGSDKGYAVYNWSAAKDANDLNDLGCRYSFAEVEKYDPDLSGILTTDKGLTGRWSRNTTLAAGKTWNISAVVGLVAPGQQRRSILAYVERERAVTWRPMPIYNSWYELNINRNNAAPPAYSGNMTIEQCVDVVDQWHKNLYEKNDANIGAFVWDDGWDSYGTWTFNPNFPNGFKEVDEVAREMNTGIGAWLGPVGGYGASGNYRRKYWTDKGQQMRFSNPEYYQVFLDAVTNLTTSYDFRYFKLDGISAQFSSVGPDAGTEGEENAEGIIDIEQRVREIKPDIFLNTTVGTWASPFWFRYTDCVWRQENDFGKTGPGTDREQWITYRDRLVYQNFVQNSRLCPINSIMTHGFILSKFGGVASDRTYEGVVRELRCAFACGGSMVELYADYSLLNEINSGKLWGDIAECIKWQEKNADVLPDAHWVGGNPWDGTNANVYGWASWNGVKSTLALRNPATTDQTFTFTLREALDIPDYFAGSIILKNSFEVQDALEGVATETPIDIDTELTAKLPGSSLFVFDGRDSETPEPVDPVDPVEPVDPDEPDSSISEITEAAASSAIYDLQGRRVLSPARAGLYIRGGRVVKL